MTGTMYPTWPFGICTSPGSYFGIGTGRYVGGKVGAYVGAGKLDAGCRFGAGCTGNSGFAGSFAT